MELSKLDFDFLNSLLGAFIRLGTQCTVCQCLQVLVRQWSSPGSSNFWSASRSRPIASFLSISSYELLFVRGLGRLSASLSSCTAIAPQRITLHQPRVLAAHIATAIAPSECSTCATCLTQSGRQQVIIFLCLLGATSGNRPTNETHWARHLPGLSVDWM